MQPNIVFLDEYTLGGADLTRLHELGRYTGYSTIAPDEVADRCRDAEIVITNKVVMRRETLAALPGLRLICIAATGMNNIDLDAAAELCRQAGLSDVRIVHDLTDRPRIVRAIVTEPKQRQ